MKPNEVQLPVAFCDQPARYLSPSGSVTIFSVEDAMIVFGYMPVDHSIEVWGIRREDNRAEVLTSVWDAQVFFGEN